jgi:PKD repeat protein
MKKILLSIAVICCLFSQTKAQTKIVNDTAMHPYWIEMMQDPSANFYDVQRAFNTYWAGKSPGKSSGWKQFKRWEYKMQFQIDEQGNRLPQDQVYKNVLQFKSQKNTTSSANWTNIGPIDLPVNAGTGQPNGMGRVNAVGFHPSNPQIIFAGAPQGGLWKSEDAGNTWTPLTDGQPTLGVSSIIVDINNPDIILLGSGDRDAGDADGMGVFKSTDGGNSWQLSNNGMGTRTVGRMIQDPNEANTILAATDGGIYKSTDLGDSWQLVKAGGFKDILFKPGNSNIVYTISGGNFYKSTDNGDSFSISSSGLPSGSRGAIAVSPDNPEYVYALLSSGSMFGSLNRSTDGGDTWNTMSTSPNIFDYSCDGGGTSGQAWYDMDVAVDPNNAEYVFVGGVNTWISTNGGVDWQIKSHWYGGCGVPAVHADMHIYEINPLNNRLYDGNDGGLYFTDDLANSWTQISSGLAISQIYKIGSSATVKDLVINGYQDNGTATFTPEGWKTVMGGDGMDCSIDGENPSYSYGEYYYGAIDRIYNNSNDQGNVTNSIPEEGAWVTPFALSNADAKTMFVGMKGVWRTHDVRSPAASQVQWTKISDFSGSNCNMLVQSDANPDILWVAKGSSLYMTLNANDESPSWDQLSGLPGGGDVRSIATDPNNENRIFMARGNGIYYSDDLCDSWTDITGGLPNIPMTSIVFYKNSIDGLYVGAQAGVYYKDASLDDWTLYNDGLPLSSQITELEIYYDAVSPSGDLLRASTYGRGLWETSMFQGILSPDFVADQTTIPSGCAVQFTDLTTGVPTSWIWTFDGGTPATSNEQNPSVIYANNGVFSVSLEVTNDNGSQTITKEDYINVEAGLNPEIHFTADQQYFCPGEAMLVHFQDESLYCPSAWNWSFSPDTYQFIDGTDATSQNPVVEFTTEGNYSITLVVTNSNGSSDETVADYIRTGGAPLPYYEDFEEGSVESSGWEIVNEDGGETWETQSISGNGGEQAMGIRFRDYVNFGARDRLISPIIELGEIPAELSFQHAYAQYYPQYTDSLIVLISTDCGDSWTRLLAKGEDGNGIFATHPQMNDEFIPNTADDWCGSGWGSDCYSIDLSAYTNQAAVKIAFESYNMRGTTLFIDHVLVDQMIGTEDLDEAVSGIEISPNPNHGDFKLSAHKNIVHANIEIYNPLGQLVFSKTGTSLRKQESLQINLKAQSKGVYLVKINSGGEAWESRFIVE